jgi:hypothetical protein
MFRKLAERRDGKLVEYQAAAFLPLTTAQIDVHTNHSLDFNLG